MNCVCLIWYLQYLNDWDVGREGWIWYTFGKISDLGWISDNFGRISDKGHVIWMLQSNRLRVLCLSTVSACVLPFLQYGENFRYKQLNSTMQYYTLFFSVFVVITQLFILLSWSRQILVSEDDDPCFNESCGVEFNPYTPLIPCSYL